MKIIINVIAALLVIALLVAITFDKVEFKNSITIDRPAPQAWLVLMDEHQAARWLEGLQRVETVFGQTRGVDSKRRFVYDDYASEETALEVVPPRLYVAQSLSPRARMLSEFAIEDMGEQCQLSWHSIMQPRGWRRVFIPLLKRGIAKQRQRDLEALKRLVETEPVRQFAVAPTDEELGLPPGSTDLQPQAAAAPP
ncbi:MAG: SRPBCC family protein [Steroidobacteraceae bacterium]